VGAWIFMQVAVFPFFSLTHLIDYPRSFMHYRFEMVHGGFFAADIYVGFKIKSISII
jgi:hypothetical protein